MGNFNKLVVIEPIVITTDGMIELKNYCKELVIYDTVPQSDNECIDRIGNADAVLTSWQAKITRAVICKCPNLKYIGMGCSFNDEKYSNIDIIAAREKGIVVSPLKDYGDEGTVEYIVAELLNVLHGLKNIRWKEKVCELGGLDVGIIGLGKIGGMTAKALKFFGSNVFYYSRTRKQNFENDGTKYLELSDLLKNVDVAILCVNRDTEIMDKRAFETFGNGKILVNISLGTCYNVSALDKWLDEDNIYICDNASMNDKTKHIKTHKSVVYNDLYAGYSMQTDIRATNQTISNIKNFIGG